MRTTRLRYPEAIHQDDSMVLFRLQQADIPVFLPAEKVKGITVTAPKYRLALYRADMDAWLPVTLEEFESVFTEEELTQYIQALATASKLTEDEQCTSSSWRGKSHRPYGPAGFNRCIRRGFHEEHKDDFGNVWTVEGKILRHETPEHT